MPSRALSAARAAKVANTPAAAMIARRAIQPSLPVFSFQMPLAAPTAIAATATNAVALGPPVAAVRNGATA